MPKASFARFDSADCHAFPVASLALPTDEAQAMQTLKVVPSWRSKDGYMLRVQIGSTIITFTEGGGSAHTLINVDNPRSDQLGWPTYLASWGEVRTYLARLGIQATTLG